MVLTPRHAARRVADMNLLFQRTHVLPVIMYRSIRLVLISKPVNGVNADILLCSPDVPRISAVWCSEPGRGALLCKIMLIYGIALYQRWSRSPASIKTREYPCKGPSNMPLQKRTAMMASVLSSNGVNEVARETNAPVVVSPPTAIFR